MDFKEHLIILYLSGDFLELILYIIIKYNLKYPIIMDTKGNIFDGVHRYIKSKLLNKKTIKAYIFDDKLLNKFIINKTGDYNTKLEINEYIEFFYKKFI